MIEATEFSVHDMRAALDGARAKWDEVRAGSNVATRRLRIAEVDVEIVVAGDSLAALLLPPFDGLARAQGPARAVVGAWDTSATGSTLPRRPDHVRDGPFRCQVRREGELVAEVQWSDAAMGTSDRDAGLHLLALRSVADLPSWEAAAPLRRQLSWALSPEVLFVHAAAVGTRDGVALVMGPGGSGKSSTSLACVQAGMGFLSDDYCLVRGAPPIAHRLHTSARVVDEDAGHFDALAPPVAGATLQRDADAELPKAMYLLHDSVPEQLLASAPARVVLVAEARGDRRARLEPIGAGEALRLVAPSTLKQMSIEPERELRSLRELLASVPCHRLVLSTDRAANPLLVQEALDRATRV